MLRLLCKAFLALTGWRFEGQAPSASRYVLIAAPHTSNWDFPIAFSLGMVLGLRVSWIGKHTLFRFPFGWLFRRLGGIPVRRHVREGAVDQLARVIREADRLVLAVTVEGTRSRVDYWKSGFFHIAEAAGVPIVLGYLDYPRRRGGLGLLLDPREGLPAVMGRIRAFYSDKVGKHPDLAGPIRLREETE